MTNTYISLLSNDKTASQTDIYPIVRRGISSGSVQINPALHPDIPSLEAIQALWQKNEAIYLPEILKADLEQFADEIKQSRNLYQAILDEAEVETMLDEKPYIDRLGEKFQLLSTRFDEADPQEILSVDFDVMDGDSLVMEDIWMRISWLSFHEEDASLRFRFSFGMENFEDVSSDPERQLAAAELSQRVFPESAIITENETFIQLLQHVLSLPALKFVERIVYFNAPNGGAQFHHDAEKGHLGVVYAQLTGETFWLALSREQLVYEVNQFITVQENLDELKQLIDDEKQCSLFVSNLQHQSKIADMLNEPGHEEMTILLNQSPLFFKQMVEAGYARYLKAGDIILLPQESMTDCAWHSVFCVSEEAGEALSFAIKPV
ncbi:MAG TPA: hypothetical protein ENJ28_11930 [Gammaproteobacteria bacterium]|nr:hypothetical protein [Gammaproteobacteria bacterium]